MYIVGEAYGLADFVDHHEFLVRKVMPMIPITMMMMVVVVAKRRVLHERKT